MPDVNIGALPNLADVQDDALLAVEFEGKAYHLNGAQWKAFARQAVSAYSEAAAKSATDAAAAQTAAEQAKTAAETAKTTAETAAKSVAENASAAQTAKNTAVSAANRAQGYTTNPPKPSEDGTVWMLWDGTQYVTTDIPARSELLPKIWTADFDTHGMVGEVILLSSLSGPEEATLESVNSGDFLISTKDGGILRVSMLFESFWGQPDTPCAGMDPVIYGYLPKYPATLTVGFSQGCDFVCDGVDDQVEIMEALKALPPLGGKIFFEGGDYHFSGQVYPQNENGTPYALGAVELYCSVAEVRYTESMVNSRQAKFICDFEGGGASWKGMFCLRSAEKLTIKNLIFESAYNTDGLCLESLDGGLYLENVVFDGFRNAVDANPMANFVVMHADKCRFANNIDGLYGNTVFATNCIFENNSDGVLVGAFGSGCKVVGCVFLSNAVNGVQVSRGSVYIANNVFCTVADAGIEKPLSVSANLGAVVAGNTFVGVNVTETNGNTFVGNHFKEE